MTTTAVPGWYPREDAPGMLGYWDGSNWTEQLAPIPGATRPCDYCTSQIPAAALRCPVCSGQFRYCRRCKINAGTRSHQKFVGFARGGMKEQHRCLHCNAVLDGPRF